MPLETDYDGGNKSRAVPGNRQSQNQQGLPAIHDQQGEKPVRR
jgi:hypothetical protein